jgi:hypothetical protein
MSGTEEKGTEQGPEQEQDADKVKLPASLAYRIGWLSFGAIAIPIFSYAVLYFLSKQQFSSISKIEDIANLANLAVASASIATLVATIWAIQSYWRLRDIDKQTEKWQPKKHKKDCLDPYTFHILAESHKQWAQLWFSWCVAIFLGGVTYAIYNSAIAMHPMANFIKECPDKMECLNLEWQYVIYSIISTQAPNSFIYLLFGVVWYWASKHYRSHWHNFVIKAYRHRALHRFETLREDIQTQIEDDSSFPKIKAEETILELYRLSGVLLLIPGDSSYLDKVGGDELSKAILQMEEISKAFTGPR